MKVTLNNHENFISIQQLDERNAIDHVPAMIYTIGMTPNGPVMFKDRPNYDVPVKKYGEHAKYYDRITKNYDPESRGFGVILDGVKGAGKSLLAEDLGNHMIKRGHPVLVIDTAISSMLLLHILQIVGPCMVYFDEFGKMYTDEKERDRMLTLFSDTSIRGVLFMVTSNGTRELSDYMINRPGRFKYRIHYKGMSVDTAREIATTMGLEDWKVELVANFVRNDGQTFDQVLTLAREIAGDQTMADVLETVSILNIPNLNFKNYEVKAMDLDGEPIDRDDFAELRYEDGKFHFEIMKAGQIAYVGEVVVADMLSTRGRVWIRSADERLIGTVKEIHNDKPDQLTVAHDYAEPAQVLYARKQREEQIAERAARGLDRPGSIDFAFGEGSNVQSVGRLRGPWQSNGESGRSPEGERSDGRRRESGRDGDSELGPVQDEQEDGVNAGWGTPVGHVIMLDNNGRPVKSDDIGRGRVGGFGHYRSEGSIDSGGATWDDIDRKQY